MYTYTFHEADTLKERRHVCGAQANTRRTPNKPRNLLIRYGQKEGESLRQ